MDLLLHISQPYPGCWFVVDDNYDGEGAPQGSGSTKYEAIRDYIDQIEELEL